MPEPFARLHEDSLRQYNKSGESEVGVVDYVRIMLVLTKDGTVTPVVSSFKDAPVGEGSSYIWALRELRTDANYIIADADGVLTAIDTMTATVWGIDVSLLESRSQHITFFIPDWHERLAEMQTASGAVVKVERGEVTAVEGGVDGSDNSSDDTELSLEVPVGKGAKKVAPHSSSTRTSPRPAPSEDASPPEDSLMICCRVQTIGFDGAMVIHWKRMSLSDLVIHSAASVRRSSKAEVRRQSIVEEMKSTLTVNPVSEPPQLKRSSMVGGNSETPSFSISAYRASVAFAAPHVEEVSNIDNDNADI